MASGNSVAAAGPICNGCRRFVANCPLWLPHGFDELAVDVQSLGAKNTPLVLASSFATVGSKRNDDENAHAPWTAPAVRLLATSGRRCARADLKPPRDVGGRA